MLYQNRPFFRKLIIVKTKPLNNLKKKFFKSQLRTKLTPHKTKKTLREQSKPIKFIYSRFSRDPWKLIYISPDCLNVGFWGLYRSSSGVLFKQIYGNLGFILDYYQWVNTANHLFFSKFKLKDNWFGSLSVTNLLLQNKKIGNSSVVTITLNRDESVSMRLNKVFFFFESSSIISKKISRSFKTWGVTSRVRGIAKNPVDHPNGGRANTKGSFRTPWGKIAKFGK